MVADPLDRLGRMFPELKLFKNSEARKVAWKKAYNRLYRQWRLYLWLLVVSATLTALKSASGTVLPVSETVKAVMFGALIGIAFIYGVIWLFQKPIQQSLRRQLLESGVPVCLKCGYCLRGLLQPRCPECGTPFEASILEPKHQAPQH